MDLARSTDEIVDVAEHLLACQTPCQAIKKSEDEATGFRAGPESYPGVAVQRSRGLGLVQCKDIIDIS